ncbi:hypothetical protein phi1422_0029 [Bdellovibrio phage phi1422]|nr:hypothetical protein F395_gp29 [Bdellovibrio phage phi1422]AFC22549.1 hypothetical protein phi1422_0029 [Bdellovibrio phage phi1422]
MDEIKFLGVILAVIGAAGVHFVILFFTGVDSDTRRIDSSGE